MIKPDNPDSRGLKVFVNELGRRTRLLRKPGRSLVSATVLTVAASLLVAGPVRQAAAEPDPQEPSSPSVTTFPRPEDPDAALRAAVAEAKQQNKPAA